MYFVARGVVKNCFHTRSWLATLGALFRLCVELSGAPSASKVSEINKEGKFSKTQFFWRLDRLYRVCPRSLLSADQAFLLCNGVDLPQHFQHAPELVWLLVRSIESQASPVHEQERSTSTKHVHI